MGLYVFLVFNECANYKKWSFLSSCCLAHHLTNFVGPLLLVGGEIWPVVKLK